MHARNSLPPLILLLGVVYGAVATAAGHGAIMAGEAWSRATPPGVQVGAAYLQLSNHGAEADRLLSATSPVAARVEIHESRMDQGVMRMRQRAAVDLPAGQTVQLAPGGLHLMLLELHQPLAAGSQFPLQLQFERTGSITLQVPVRALGAGGAGSAHAGHAPAKAMPGGDAAHSSGHAQH